MKRWLVVGWLAMAAIACGKTETVVRVQKTDGSAVIGQVTQTLPDAIVVRDQGGQTQTILKKDIVSQTALAPAGAAPPPPGAPPAAGDAPAPSTPPGGLATSLAPEGSAPVAPAGSQTSGAPGGYTERTAPASEPPAAIPDAATPPPPPAEIRRELTVPAGTTLRLTLQTSLASNRSHIEDPVRARLRNSLVVSKTTVVPAGAILSGSVTNAKESARVKGRAQLAFRFDTIEFEGERHAIRTRTVSMEAEATKGEDAKKIGIGAGVGAVIGGIAGGGKGAAIGAGVGGGAGTGVVLSTRGKEVQLGSGAAINTVLESPLRVSVLVKEPQ